MQQTRAAKAPKFPNEEDEDSVLPVKFTKLHRRAGDRLGLYLAETKNRFVVSDGQREVVAMFALLFTGILVLFFMILGKALEEAALIIVAGCLVPCLGVEVFFMKRLTTTLDRRRRRMVQDTTRWLCFTRRNEFDLDDVVKVSKRGLGRKAVIEAELSSGETVALTYESIVVTQEDLKTNGPNRMNNFLLRVRGLAKRQFPPKYVLARAKFDPQTQEEGDGDDVLHFEALEVIKVLECEEGNTGWWRGKLASGKEGWFPARWTQEMAPSELAASAANKSESGGPK